MELSTLVSRLKRAATASNERRLLVLTGDRTAGLNAIECVVAAAGVEETTTAGDEDGSVSVVTTREGSPFHRLHPNQAGELMGTSREIVVYDCHEAFDANTLGQLTGAVDGGGLLVLLLPPLEDVPESLTALVDQVAVPPYDREAVGNRFRKRLVRTLEAHPGIAIAELAESAASAESDAHSSPEITIKRDGGITSEGEKETTNKRDGETPTDQQREPQSTPHVYTDTPFPAAAYEASLTSDQSRAVAQLSTLSSAGNAVVVEADRGRGKSSAAGIAAAGLAANGHDVCITAPTVDNTGPLFERARELLTTLGCLDSSSDDSHPTLSTTTGGRIYFEEPTTAVELRESPTVVIVDEAAALPVGLVEKFLAAPSVGFCTTVHGYEGAGRGFAIRFRERLADSDHAVQQVELREPIRYSRTDPVESWLAWTLLLDAEPPAEPVVADATPETVQYRTVTSDELAENEPLLRSVFGLLVAAHYRTEPTDLVRLLDAPNLELRALCWNDHPVSVVLLAREGGLDSETQAASYRGQRLRGNMLPDLLTSQLRDPNAGTPVGYRVMRIATHHAVRSRGLGSKLLSAAHAELGEACDWFGVGYGATPRLLSFWAANGYRTVHLSVTPNAKSGAHSAVMLRPASATGTQLTNRHVRWFRERVAGQLADTLSTLDPDVVRAALAAATLPETTADLTIAEPTLSERSWRLLAGVADGPGTYEIAPHVFRELTMTQLFASVATLTAKQERLLVQKVLQGTSWETAAEGCGFATARQCRREMTTIAKRFCEAVDNETVADERRRYEG